MTDAATPSTAVPWTPLARAGREDTPRADLDRAIDDLTRAKPRWLLLGIADRVRLLSRLLEDSGAVAAESVAAGCRAKGIDLADPRSGEEWLAGPLVLHRNLRLLRQSLAEVEAYGRPQIPGPVTERASGQLVARVYPASTWDRVLFPGLTAEVWMEPGVTRATLAEHQGAVYRKGAKREAKVALVLGAGNVASIGPTDVLYKLFVEDQPCLLKMNPVNEYLGPFVERGFRSLIDAGYLRVVYGGAEVGKYLCAHPGIDEIHITGSDKTHDAIVWGPPGPEREERKKKGTPLLTKRITSELGNVSPVIVAPGPWSEADIRFHALSVASQVVNNGSFNCNAAKCVITHAGWPQRQAFLDAVKAELAKAPPRRAYYPGAEDRYKAFVAAHPEAEAVGAKAEHVVPWTLIPGVDPKRPDDVCFKSEAFCGVLAETALEAKDAADFLARATRFANDVVWGTLNCCVIVHPRTLEQPGVEAAFERALDDLRYGTIAVNVWPAVGYGLVVTTWGAFPGHPLDDIQSGRGVVHNTYLFDRPQKSVVRAPFRQSPLPPWFYRHRRTNELGGKLARFEQGPGWLKLPGIIWSAIRG